MREIDKPNFKSEFYEDAGDPLAEFRKKCRGPAVGKKGKDPFANDPDVLQAQREEKLIEDSRNIDTGGFGSY